MDYFAITCAVLFIGMWAGFSGLGLNKAWSGIISIGGGFIASLVSMFPFLFSYAAWVNTGSVLYSAITLLSIFPVGWAWILIFRIKDTSFSNSRLGEEICSKTSESDKHGLKPSVEENVTGPIETVITEATVTSSTDQNEERILRELKKHKEYYDKAMCLDCGYEGIAGVVGRRVPWYVSLWVIVPLCFTGIGIFGGLVLGLFRATQTKAICECPNCESNCLIG